MFQLSGFCCSLGCCSLDPRFQDRSKSHTPEFQTQCSVGILLLSELRSCSAAQGQAPGGFGGKGPAAPRLHEKQALDAGLVVAWARARKKPYLWFGKLRRYGGGQALHTQCGTLSRLQQKVQDAVTGTQVWSGSAQDKRMHDSTETFPGTFQRNQTPGYPFPSGNHEGGSSPTFIQPQHVPERRCSHATKHTSAPADPRRGIPLVGRRAAKHQEVSEAATWRRCILLLPRTLSRGQLRLLQSQKVGALAGQLRLSLVEAPARPAKGRLRQRQQRAERPGCYGPFASIRVPRLLWGGSFGTFGKGFASVML